MNTLIAYHNTLVQLLFAIVLINAALAYFLKDKMLKFVTYSRIGYFAFWAAWAMAVFAGLIVFVFMKNPINIKTITMIIASILLPFLDGYRAIKLRKIWLSQNESGYKLSLTILAIELIIIIATTIIAIKL